LLSALPPGSYLVLSDATDTSPALSRAVSAYNGQAAIPYWLRSPREVARFFDGLTHVSPGLLAASRWQPDLTAADSQPPSSAICGVGRKD